jgi:hypothetical protein
MKIAIDYDGTYTRDPILWDTFITIATESGHEVVCVTMRHPSEPIQMSCPVLYTCRKAKALYYAADIWIDDKPQWLFADSA